MNLAMEAAVTEVMTLPVAENESGMLCAAALPQLSSFLARVDALVLGPGLDIHPDTVYCVHTLLRQATVPIVLDADGLNSLVGHLHVLRDCQAPVLLTPHPGEMARSARNEYCASTGPASRNWRRHWRSSMVCMSC